MGNELSNAERLLQEIKRSATQANLITIRYVAMAFIPMASFMLYLGYNTPHIPSFLLRVYIIMSSGLLLIFSPPPAAEAEVGERHRLIETLYGGTIPICLVLINGLSPIYSHTQSLFIMTMFGLAAFFRIPHRKALFLYTLLCILEISLLVRGISDEKILRTNIILCIVVSAISLLLSRLVYSRWEKAYRTQRLIEDHRTELERKERELRESEHKYKALVQNFPNGIVAMYDNDLRFLLADGKGFEPFGLKGCALQNKVVWECLPAEIASILGPLFRRTLSGEENTTEVEISGRTCEVHLLPLRNADGQINAGMIVSMDVTERKRAEALREDVERMTRHDIKTPLNAIMGMADLLLEEDLPPDIQEGIKIIRKSGLRVFNIVNHSLNLLKMERGTYHFHSLPVNLLNLIAKIWEEMGPLAKARQVGMNLTLYGKTPTQGDRFIAQAEELLCYTMLANLLRNAVEASPHNGIVSVELTDKETFRQIRIRNLGEVPEQIRDRFFEKFVTHGKPGGTGLGAYSAKLIVRTLGGSITLDDSTPNETVIILTLPA